LNHDQWKNLSRTERVEILSRILDGYPDDHPERYWIQKQIDKEKT